MHVDLVKDLVNSLLCYVGNLFKWLGAFGVIMKFFAGSFFPLFLFRIEQVGYPVEETVHPRTPIVSSFQLDYENQADNGSAYVGNVAAAIFSWNAGKVDDHENDG